MTITKYTKSLRKFRNYHKVVGLAIAFFVLVSALTGILLAWKKDINLLQPPTAKGVSKDLSTWKPIAELAVIAREAFTKEFPEKENHEIDRMDVRPSKGIVKVLMDKGWWEVQVDGTSGEVLSIKRRHSDWIEQLHDGSIVSQLFKLITMNGLGIGLILMLITGLWLWYGPKKVRKIKKVGPPKSPE